MISTTVYVIMAGQDRFDHAKWIAGVFTSRDALLEKVNADPEMKAIVNDSGDVEIRGVYWYSVVVRELDNWE